MATLEYIQSTAAAPYGTPSQPTSGSLPLQSLLFGIQIGLDTSNNFALSVDPHGFEIGLAVQTPGGRFLTMDRRRCRLVDVTALVVPVNPWVYRIPIRPKDVKPTNLLVTGDPPDFSALYVLENPEGGPILGLDFGTCQEVIFRPPENPFLDFAVRAVSLFDVLVS
jgi:hypothetical protein